MNAQQRDREGDVRSKPVKTRRGLEMTIFLVASAVGIYGIGKGLAGLYERGQEINLLWLAVTGAAFFVLAAQMGRVHDSWPHRPGKEGLRTANAQVTADDESPHGDRE